MLAVLTPTQASTTDPESVWARSRVPHGGTTDPTVFDFSASINPERPDGAEAVYRKAFDASTRYPDDSYVDLRAATGDYVGCIPEVVVSTAGGLEALWLAFEVTLSLGDAALAPEPSFGERDRETRL